MKTTGNKFAQVAGRAARDAKIFFFCGPDEAGAHTAAARIVELLPEPGERVEIEGAELRRDPVRLADETRSASLFGDRQHIFVRASGEEALEALKILVESPEQDIAAGWPVLIVASGATDKSRSAKLLEKRGDALVAMFHPPDLSSMTNEVRRLADAAGLRLDASLAQRIAHAANLDTRLAGAEIAKLALYLDAAPAAPRGATADDLDAIGAPCDDDSLMPLVDAVLSGDGARLTDELVRFRTLSLNPVGSLLAMERRASQLAELAARMGSRGDVARFVEQEVAARRIFFRDKGALIAQLQIWQGDRLARLIDRLITVHRELISDSREAELRFAGACTQIARAAASGRPR